jgi:N-acetylglucosaminyldiphosphoundecaprenol N-acetyl-beta-D-mannosaminyltransferase
MSTEPAAASALLPTVAVHGVDFCAISETQCVRHILDQLDAGRGGWAVTANLDHLRRLVKDDSYRRLCEPATLMVADGMPVVWASHLKGTPLPQRVAGSSLIWTLTEAAATRRRSVFLLGGEPGTANAAAEALVRRCPGLAVAGTYCPPLGFDRDPDQIERLAAAVSAATPDIVYVALGSPKQERLIGDLRGRLPRAWWLGVGISFSYVCGHVRRAPAWMRHIGVEWLYRLVQEPRRLARRYLVDGCPFAVRLLYGAAVERFTGASRRGH